MTDIEQLISRYLDRELSPEEEGMFHRILSESPEARRQLREMEMIRSAARRMPALTIPAPQVESLLFQQLFAEESAEESVAAEEEPERRRGLLFLSRISDTARRRSGVLAAALLLVGLLGGGGFWISGGNSGTPSLPIADASASLPGEKAASAMTQSAIIGNNSASSLHSLKASPVTPETMEGNENRVAVMRINGRKQEGTSSAKKEVNSGRTAPEAEGYGDREGTNLPYALNPETTLDNPDNLNGRDIASSWPPAGLLTDSRSELPENLGNATAPSQEQNGSLLYPALSSYKGKREDQGVSASYRHGLAYVEDGESDFTTQDFSLRVEGRFNNRHRISLAVGQSPLLVERTSHTLPTGVDEKGPSTASAERVEHFSQLTDEVWAGVGYGYAVVATKRIRLEPGLNFGVGERSLRFSAELPVRYRLNDRFSLDLVASVSRVQPHDQVSHGVDRQYDRKSFLHVAEEQHPVFTTVGASIGLSFDIGQ